MIDNIENGNFWYLTKVNCWINCWQSVPQVPYIQVYHKNWTGDIPLSKCDTGTYRNQLIVCDPQNPIKYYPI